VIAAAAAAALLAATATTAEAQTGEPVPYRTIASDWTGRYTAKTTFVIRDRRRYRHVWQRLQHTIPAPRRPRINFRRRMLIAVLRGSGTGTGLVLESVTREGSGMLVRVTETRAGAGCVVPQWVTNDYELIAVPRTAGPVRTERAERVVDCA